MRQPGLLRGIDKIPIRLSLKQRERLGRKIRHNDGFAAVAKNITRSNAHASPWLAVRRIGQPVGQPHFFEYSLGRVRLWAAPLIDPEMIRRAIVGDHETGKTVRTEISCENAEPWPRLRVETHLIGHIFETPVPEVAIQLCRRPLER